MKRLITMVLALMIALCGFAALGEGNAANEVNCLIEEGSFIIQIDDPEGDLGWVADDMSQDPSVVTLYDADLIEDTFVVRYDPAGDGVMTVGVRHYIGITCDKAYTFDLHVENGAVTEITGGSHKASPDETEQDPYLSGEWLEQEIQYTSLSIKKNPTRGWDVEAASPLTHGAYIFKATIYYDCERDSFVYDKGKFWDVPITESNEESDLGEVKIAGATGSFTLGGESIENATLTWHNDENGEDIVFARTNDAVTDAPDWTYYTFEGTGVAIKLSGDFAVTVEEPTDGTIFQAINGDVHCDGNPGGRQILRSGGRRALHRLRRVLRCL